jgi:hypothetical protein
MNTVTRTKTSAGDTRSGRLFLIELSGDRIHSMNPDGLNRRTIVTDCRLSRRRRRGCGSGHIYQHVLSPTSTTARSNGPTSMAGTAGSSRKASPTRPKQIHVDKERDLANAHARGGRLDRAGSNVDAGDLRQEHADVLRPLRFSPPFPF